MSRYTDLAARAEQHLATAETAADDPHVAAQCALAAAILAGRPRPLRSMDLEQYLADTEHATDPAVLAGRAVAAAVQAAAVELDELDVDDCGFPVTAVALSSPDSYMERPRSAARSVGDDTGTAAPSPHIAGPVDQRTRSGPRA